MWTGLALHWPAGLICMSHLYSPLSCWLLIYPLFGECLLMNKASYGPMLMMC